MKIKSLLFIGLVDLNQNKGDSNHFKKLTNYFIDKNDSYIISFTQINNDFHETISYPKNKFIRLIYWNLRIAYLIFKFKMKKNISVIYFRESGMVISPYFVCKLLKIKIIVEINGVLIDDLPLPRGIIKNFYSVLYSFANGFVASKGYGLLIQKNFNVNKNKICSVNLGHNYNNKIRIESEKFSKFTLVFIGNITQYQGLELFIRGLKLYIENYSKDVQLLIYGDGPDKENIILLSNKLKINSYVQFNNAIDQKQLMTILPKCHVGLSPFSIQRGDFGTISALKTYDYLISKLAILTSSMDEMSEFIETNNIGKSINNYTDVEISQLLFQMSNSEYLLKVQSSFDDNFNNWLKDFSWETRFDKISNFVYNA